MDLDELFEITPQKLVSVIFALVGIIGMVMTISKMTAPTAEQRAAVEAGRAQMQAAMERQRMIQEMEWETGMSPAEIEAALSYGGYESDYEYGYE